MTLPAPVMPLPSSPAAPASTSRPGPPPHLALVRSAPAAPEFAWERFNQLAHELPPLFHEHWKELALNQDTVKLDPNWDQFYALDVQGILRILTVRMEGRLIGYVFLLFGPHLHYKSTAWAHCDMFWLDPVYRQGWTGVKMFKALLRGVEEMDAKIASVPVKLHFMNARVIKLLERLGFKQTEVIMTTRIG